MSTYQRWAEDKRH